MNLEDMKRKGQLIPNSRTYLCPNGGHLSMYDDQQNYFTNLITFLKDVDGNKFTADKKMTCDERKHQPLTWVWRY